MLTEIPERILLVEDDSIDEQFLRLVLEDWSKDISVTATDSISSAITIAEENSFDCILLDFNLPDQTGLDFLRHFQTELGCQPWPVMMLSGHENSDQIVSAIKLGAKDYILKDRLHEKKILQSRIIVAMAEWSIEWQKLKISNLIRLPSSDDDQTSRHTDRYDALLREIDRIRKNYYGLLDKYNVLVARGSASASLNADLLRKLSMNERLIFQLKSEAHAVAKMDS